MSWFSDRARRGLTNRAYEKICRDIGSQGPGSLVLALGISRAVYPNGKYGTLETDEIDSMIRRRPIVTANAAGRIAEEYVDLGRLDLAGCVRRIYGTSLDEFLMDTFPDDTSDESLPYEGTAGDSQTESTTKDEPRSLRSADEAANTDAREDRFESLGAEFNTQLQRTDGEFIAKMLHGRLEQDLRDWFYDRVFRIFDHIPESEWSKSDQIGSEIQSRNEVSCFQSIESALFARESKYVSEENIDWFVDWCLRVNLGTASEYAKENRLSYFWNADEDKRVGLLSVSLVDALPKIDSAQFYIHLYGPSLILATKATVATAFADHATAKALQAEYDRVDTQLQALIKKVTSGGGTCFVIEGDKGLVITPTTQYGRVFHIWTDEKLADEIRHKYGEGHSVSEMSYRELGPQLTQMHNFGIKYVTIDSGTDGDVRVVPTAEVIQSVQEAIGKIDSSEIGAAFLSGTQG